MSTLYDKLINFENYSPISIGSTLIKHNCVLFERQKNLLDNLILEDNVVLLDAVNKRKTISNSLEEIVLINTGIKKYLPRKYDRLHNKKVDDMSKLISLNSNAFGANGYFKSDSGIVFGTITGLGLSTGYYNLSGENLPHIKENILSYEILAPIVLILGISVLAGYIGNMERILSDIPYDEAEYLDDKIKLYYHS